MSEKKLLQIAEKYAAKSNTNDVKIAVSQPSTGFEFRWVEPNSRPLHAIASSTKLFTLTMLLQLESDGVLKLDDAAVNYLPASDLHGLNTFGGKDHAFDITIKQLLSQTSGISDYFEDVPKGQLSIGQKMFQNDISWSYEDTLEISREIPAKFAPGTPGKAKYSDTNYQLLGRLIETVRHQDFESALSEMILNPQGLNQTFGFSNATKHRWNEVSGILYGDKILDTPNALASFRADGGIVSTVDDSMKFLKKFYGGELFPIENIDRIQSEWNRIFPPFKYGVGLMKFELPRIYSPFKAMPAMIGHGGASGHVMFKVPEKDLYIVAVVNQIKKRSLVYEMMTRIAMVF